MTPQPRTSDYARRLQRALAAYIDLPTLRRLLAEHAQQSQAGTLDVAPALHVPPAEQPAEVRMLLAALISLLRPVERTHLGTAADVAAFLMADMGALKQEEFRTILLTTQNEVLGVETIYRGQVDQLHIRAAEVFRPAIQANAASIILCHNHPSGALNVSQGDQEMTYTLLRIGEQLGIRVLDRAPCKCA